jgi:hypothetical protein
VEAHLGLQVREIGIDHRRSGLDVFQGRHSGASKLTSRGWQTSEMSGLGCTAINSL